MFETFNYKIENMTEIEKQFELIKPNLEWLFGMCLNVPDSVFLEEKKYNDLNSELIKINCNISYDFWDINKPIYRFLCEYENGEIEIVNITLMEILEKLNNFHNLKLNSDYDYSLNFDSVQFVTECCISERLKLIN